MTSKAIQLDINAATHIANRLDTLESESSWHVPTIMMDRAAVARAITLELRRGTWVRR
jgi:hypothetical protein